MAYAAQPQPQMQPHQYPPQSYAAMPYGVSPAASPAPAGAGGASSISALVQALQSGSISKQQLYSSLTNMYRGTATQGGGMPAQPTNSMHQPSSFALTQPAAAAAYSTHAQPMPPPPQQQQQQQQQQQPQSHAPQHSFPSFQPQPAAQPYAFQHPPAHSVPPAPSDAYTAAQSAAAQHHIQSFLSKHHAMNQSGAMAAPSANSSFNSNASLNLSSAHDANLSAILAQSHSQPINATDSFAHTQIAPNSYGGNQSLDLSGYEQQQQYQQAPSFDASGSSFGLQAGQAASYMQQQQQQQQQQQYQQQYVDNGEYSEAEEYTGSNSLRGSIHGGGGGGGIIDGPYSAARQQQANRGHQSYRGNSARNSVRERMAAVYTDEKNAELTFKPNITPLPRHIYKTAGTRHAMSGGSANAKALAESESGAEAAPFLGRVMHWSENKRARERQLSVELEKRALAECTFKPSINDESVAIVEAPGADQRRLFSARSTARAKILELEVRRKEEEAFRTQCTFEPELNKKSMHMANNLSVRPRPQSASARSGLGSTPGQPGVGGGGPGSSEAADLAECTFTPKVNNPRRSMTAAQAYLEQNAFERLSSLGDDAAAGSGYDSEGGASSKRGPIRRGRDRAAIGNSSNRARSAGGRSVSPSMRNSSNAGAAAPATPLNPPASFNEFLARLKFKEYQRVERLDALKFQEQQELQFGRPMLSKKSAKLVRRAVEEGRYASPAKAGRPGSASARGVDPSASPSVQASQLARLSDPECTFAPAINAYSANMGARSFETMSALEMARRAQNLEIQRNALRNKEMEQASFRPVLNQGKTSAQVDSRLRVLSEPDLYVERLQFQSKLRESEIARQKALRAAEELKECTFAPATHEAPEFVKRIARSMEMQKQQAAAQAGAQSKKKKQPDWK